MAEAVSVPSKTGETVTIASKLQLGLELQLQEPYEAQQELHTGAIRTETRYRKTGEPVVIQGCAVPRGEPHEKHIVGGFALTHGVDKAFWDAWLAQHRNFPPVVNGEIFAYVKPEAAAGTAKERAEIKSGAEPIDPDNLPNEFKAKVRKDSRAA